MDATIDVDFDVVLVSLFHDELVWFCSGDFETRSSPELASNELHWPIARVQVPTGTAVDGTDAPIRKSGLSRIKLGVFVSY